MAGLFLNALSFWIAPGGRVPCALARVFSLRRDLKTERLDSTATPSFSALFFSFWFELQTERFDELRVDAEAETGRGRTLEPKKEHERSYFSQRDGHSQSDWRSGAFAGRVDCTDRQMTCVRDRKMPSGHVAHRNITLCR